MSDVETVTEKVVKSIVPAKYGNKYKKGGSDSLATFINENSKGDSGFSFEKFFELCRVNKVSEEQVAKYEAQVNEKKLGAPGRARMTLRNMLATIAKKNGGLVDLDGNTHTIEFPAKVDEAA